MIGCTLNRGLLHGILHREANVTAMRRYLLMYILALRLAEQRDWDAILEPFTCFHVHGSCIAMEDRAFRSDAVLDMRNRIMSVHERPSSSTNFWHSTSSRGMHTRLAGRGSVSFLFHFGLGLFHSPPSTLLIELAVLFRYLAFPGRAVPTATCPVYWSDRYQD